VYIKYIITPTFYLLVINSQINQQISQEHAKIKAIQRTLQDISLDLQSTKFAHKLRHQLSEESTSSKDPSAWFKPDPDIWTPPPKDPDVWGPPKPPPTTQAVGRRAAPNNRRTAPASQNSRPSSTIPQSTARNGPASTRNLHISKGNFGNTQAASKTICLFVQLTRYNRKKGALTYSRHR